MKQIKNRHTSRFIVSLLIVLVVSIPLNIAIVFGQQGPDYGTAQVQIKNPKIACIEKNKKTHDLVELMDNEVIKVLEKVAATLYFSCSVWGAIEAVIAVFQTGSGFCTDGTCTSSCGSPVGAALCGANDAVRGVRNAIGYVMIPMCSLATCALCNSQFGSVDEGTGIRKDVASPARLGSYLTFELPKIGEVSPKTAGEFTSNLHLSPYDNIYIAIGCLCPVAILHNLRKLKTIYQTYNCCVEQACANGLSVQSCGVKLNEATCMYWEGSIYNSIIKAIISLAANFIAKEVFQKVASELGSSTTAMLKTLFSLYQAYTTIQGLQSTYKWMSNTFSEPKCSELGFDKIKKEQLAATTTTLCKLRPVDINGDGIAEQLQTDCGT